MRALGVILLLFCAVRTEAFRVWGPAVPLIVQMGASVTLPCSVDTPIPLSELEVQWMKEDSGALVHFFQDGKSRPESQNPSYRGRAEFFPEQVSKGNFSLLLVDLTAEDKGFYKCVVHSDQESHETKMEIDIERLVVTGAVEPVSAYAGEDVILNCSVDTHVPVGELEVEWVKIKELVQVLLFDKGENIPESQNERFRERAEFFSEEIPKGNFSMKLRDVRTEDKGEFVCIVHTDQESINATAWIQELGFSSLHILVLFCTISSAAVAVSVCIRALWFCLKKDQSNRVFLHYLHDSVPCILTAIAFTVWGAIERSFKETFVCSAINFFRILVIFKMAPYKKIMSGSCSWRLVNLALPLEFSVLTIGVSSDVLRKFLQLLILNTALKVLIGFVFVFLLLLGLFPVCASVYDFGHLQRHLECLRRLLERLRRHCQRRVVNKTATQALQIRWLVFVLLFISIDSFIAILMVINLKVVISLELLLTLAFCSFGSCMVVLCRSCIRSKKYGYLYFYFLLMFLSLLRITIGFILLDMTFEMDKERPVWMFSFVFLNILTAAASFQEKSDYSAGPQIPVFVLGSAALSIINAVSLATEVFLKAEKGERTVEDLQLIVLPFESLFLACWFGLQLFLYCKQEKEIIKDQLKSIDHCCKKGRSPISSREIQEAVEMESLQTCAESNPETRDKKQQLD